VKLILLITGNFETAKQIRRILHSDYSILTATGEESAIEFARSVLVDAILIDAGPPYQKVGELVLRTRQLQPDAAVIALVPQEIAEREKEEYLDGVYDYIRKPFSSTEVRHAVSRALERRTLLQEAKLMRIQLDKASTPLSAEQVLAPAAQIYEKTLRELSKALAASFDVKRLLNLFLDAVTEMFRVGKISVLLLDEASNEYRIEISRGLHPEFCTTLKFPHKEGIAQWLQVHGRILKMEDVRDRPASSSSLETKRELEILQAVVSVPLATKGKLIGILNLGEKATGARFTNEELETLFTLSSHVAVAIEDVFLYQKVKYQKEFTESILGRMDSGLITINELEKVSVFNPKAGEILERKADELIGKDLRTLPSPLGDMLFETMRTGKNYEKFEVEVKSPKLPLEVSTRQLLSSNGKPVGSLMLVSDIRLRRDLEEERGKASRLELLNKLTAGIAHEIKNPLSSMRTCVQLLKEKYEDEEFREFFQSTVTRDMDRLNDLIEKFVELTQPLELELATQDVHSILDEVLSSLKNGEIPENIRLSTRYGASPSETQADRKEISKGLTYVIRNAVEAMAKGGDLTVSTLSDGDSIKVSVRDTGSGIPEGQLENIWDPLFSTKNRGVGLGLPIGQKIITQHGGRIEIESTPGKGTTCHVYLPVSS
jgi:nitrogen-specific signal transduction histidine kinase/DNA-binding response OmpR family regulator